MKFVFKVCIFILFQSTNIIAQKIYFPPTSQLSNVWDTINPKTLGWCEIKIQPFYDYLESANSKAIIVLKDGKIVLENYFGTFTRDSFWYWASAGKSVTSMLIGKAQEDGKLSILDPTSKYLGNGWTNCTALQESKITIKHQITMTTGLDDGVAFAVERTEAAGNGQVPRVAAAAFRSLAAALTVGTRNTHNARLSGAPATK